MCHPLHSNSYIRHHKTQVLEPWSLFVCISRFLLTLFTLSVPSLLWIGQSRSSPARKTQWITLEPLVAVVPRFDNTGLTWIENWNLALPHTVGSCVSEITPPQSCKAANSFVNRHLCERKTPLNPWMFDVSAIHEVPLPNFKLRPSRLLIRYRVHDKQPTTWSPWTLPPDTPGQCSTLIFGSFDSSLSNQRARQNLIRFYLYT